MNTTAPLCTTARRYPRGEETRRRVIDAAIGIFGRQGYAGTSTRDIAAAAEVNTPAIQYYFGSKLGLYEASVDQLTRMVSCRIAPAVRACQASVDAGAPLAEVAAALSEVQNCLIDSFFAGPEGYAVRKLLAWEEAEREEKTADHFMKDRICMPVFRIFETVVEQIAARPMSRTELEMHALSLMGLSMIFQFDQSRVLDMLNWSPHDPDLLATIKSVAGRQLNYALAGLAHS